jgi:hypothetical protein
MNKKESQLEDLKAAEKRLHEALILEEALTVLIPKLRD